MTTPKNPNLILDPSAEPSAGIQSGNIIEWYGGPVNVEVSGVWAGASVDIVMSTKLPLDGVTVTQVDGDWITLGTLTVNGRYHDENLNPCLITTRVTSPASTTRLRGIVN